MNPDIPAITGATTLVSMLGRWPSFHDAEIIRVLIRRDGHSTITVRLMEPQGQGLAVTFTFEGILDLKLDGEDVNRQNAIHSLSVEPSGTATKVTFGPCYGLWGVITAEHVGVRVAESSEI
jgi:hypothetical protein